MTTAAPALSKPAAIDPWRRKARLAEWGQRAVLLVASLLVLAYALGPVVWLVVSSVEDEAEIVSVPPHWLPRRPTLQNYRAIFETPEKTVTYETSSHKDPAAGGYIPSTAKNLLPGMANSLEVAFAVVVLNLLVGVPAAYAIAKIRFYGRSAAVYSILATRVVPDIALVVPFFLIVKKLGLVDNILSLIVTYLAITVPFTVFVLVGYFEALPDELDKAARVDGCSRWQALRHVFLPLAVPSLVAVVLFSFLASWNEFLLALMFTQTTASQTLPIVVASFASDFTISFSFINAAGVIAVVPPILLALVFERYIVSGLTAGAVKG
jgi:multiple sugar transport system permease protein